MHSEVIPWLVLFLREHLSLAWASEDLDDSFVADGELFRCVADEVEAFNQFPAFFDRLRDKAGRLIGIQVTPMVCRDLPLILGALPFVRAVNREQQLQILFTSPI